MRSLMGSLKLLVLIAAPLCAGCVGTQASDPAESERMTYAIVLAAPTEAERNAPRPSSKGAPLQVGFGREVPAAQRRVMLSKLHWREVAGSYMTMVSVQSTGTRSLRAGLRLNKNVPGLEWSFRGSNASVVVIH